jgi:DNA mismatch repair protein MutL
LELANDAGRVYGWVAAPRVNRSTSRGVYLFVNGRAVKDRTLLHAVMQGYRQRLMKGQFPVVVCSLTVPADQVDVNVHPTKHEVRFARSREIHGLVAGAVAAALDQADRRQRPGGTDRQPFNAPRAATIAENREVFQPLPSAAQPSRSWRPIAAERDKPFQTGARSGRDQAGFWQQGRFARLNVIGQFRRTYILCESEEGLVLIDQHAAHERIFYEQLRRRKESVNAATQKLLIPETIDLSHREAALLQELREELIPLGFEIEPFGGTTFAVKAAPTMLLSGEIGPVIREVLEKALAAGGHAAPESIKDDSMKIMACHGAIRARQELDPRQIRRLLQQMDECENPSHCPHGRPTWIRWTAQELEKAFGRLA